jgi:DNA-binding NarL/FixJ family response regulator
MRLSVLIVDDHARFRRGARAMLEADGFDVVGEAADGEEALREAALLRPAVLLLDIQLPDTDGFAIARRLAVEAAGTAVILISSRDARDYGGRVEGSGTAGFIPKARLSGTAIRALLG